MTISCGDGTQESIELDAEEVAEIINDPLFLEIVSEQVPERVAEVQAALNEYETFESGTVMALAP